MKLIVPDFIPRTKIARKIAKFVREIGTRAEWQRDGKWSEDAGYCSHQGDEYHLFCSYFLVVYGNCAGSFIL